MEVAKWTAKYTNRNTEFHLHPLGDIGLDYAQSEDIYARFIFPLLRHFRELIWSTILIASKKSSCDHDRL